jgi:hypothetical protein
MSRCPFCEGEKAEIQRLGELVLERHDGRGE